MNGALKRPMDELEYMWERSAGHCSDQHCRIAGQRGAVMTGSAIKWCKAEPHDTIAMVPAPLLQGFGALCRISCSLGCEKYTRYGWLLSSFLV